MLRTVATQIIYITTPPKRPKVLKHAHTFPPDKNSSPKTAALKESVKGKGTTRKRSIMAIADTPAERPSKKRAAPSSLPSEVQAKDQLNASGERVIKRARHGPTPMSPPDTPDKTVDSNPLSLVSTPARGIATQETRLPMSDSEPNMDSTRISGLPTAPQVSGV